MSDSLSGAALSAAQLNEGHLRQTGDGSTTLYSPRFGQTYGSLYGAEAQARAVFVEGSGAAHLPLGRVLEIGFGIGQNLRATLAARGRASLEYLAYEIDPVPAELLAEVSAGRPGSSHPLWQALLAAWPDFVAGMPALQLQAGSASLCLRRANACQAELPTNWAEAIYLDGFSPEANLDLWAPDFLARLSGSLVPGGALVTYSAAGRVRRALAAAGLAVEKRPGPPGKREVIKATRPSLEVTP